MFIKASDTYSVSLSDEEYALLSEETQRSCSLLDVVTIRGKMDYKTKSRVIDGISAYRTDQSLSMNVGSYNLLLLTANILSWSGPSFRHEDGTPVAVTDNSIGQLDPSNPLIEKVLRCIQERNLTPETQNPK